MSEWTQDQKEYKQIQIQISVWSIVNENLLNIAQFLVFDINFN